MRSRGQYRGGEFPRMVAVCDSRRDTNGRYPAITDRSWDRASHGPSPASLYVFGDHARMQRMAGFL